MKRILVIFLAVVVVIVGGFIVTDMLTSTGARQFVGGTPEFGEGETPPLMLGSRAVRFPPLLQQDFRRAAVLDKDFYFCHRESGAVIRIPRTYQTDFASIPAVARILVDRLGNSLEPAGIHDWLYTVGEGAQTPQREAYRAFADRLFLDAMEDNNVGLATRTVMYWAVRLGGDGAYGRDSEWNGRFRDPRDGVAVTPPFPRPETGAIARVDCGDFERKILLLVGCHSSDPALRFEAEDQDLCTAGPVPPGSVPGFL